MSVNVAVCLLIFIIQTNIILTLNNRIRSPIPPLNLPINEIPMFLTITIDDALHSDSHGTTAQILNHFNRNSEQIPIVYFVSNEFTDYRSVQDRYLQGCEIAAHTVTHTTKVNTDLMKWYHEIQTSRDLLSVHTDIPLDEIIGFRAPFLEKSDFSFQVLNGITPALTYDSTIIATLDNNDLFDWPYTLDEYEPMYAYQVGEGPAQSYPGLWEIPMYIVYSSIPAGTHFNAMDYSGNYTVLLNAFKDNFLHRLNTNRAPMGLYLHSIWLEKQSNADALNDFITWVLEWDDTWVVTNKEVIDWINNPVTNSNYDFRNTNQLMNGKTSFRRCEYPTSFIYTVETVCPATLPHVLTWDTNQLISTAITVSSVDNELITVQEICSNDVYSTYDMNSIYCDGVSGTVRYMNKLYSCKWWTQGDMPGVDIPGVDPVWLWTKDCMVYIFSFVKGNISQYGTFNMFENNVLDINVQIYDAYRLDTVSVFVDGVAANLDVFDSYSLVYNSLVDVSLSIQFNNINFATSELEFSFRDANTSEPTPAPSNNPTMTPSLFPSTPPTPFPSKNPSTPPTKYPSFSPSMPSYTPTMAPTGLTSAPSAKPIGLANLHTQSVAMSYTTLIVISGSVLLTILLCVCGVYCVMKREKMRVIKDFEDNIVHTIRVQSNSTHAQAGVFPGTGLGSMASSTASTGSTMQPPPIQVTSINAEV